MHYRLAIERLASHLSQVKFRLLIFVPPTRQKTLNDRCASEMRADRQGVNRVNSPLLSWYV
ncbi:hypothetical protein [Paenibacillus campi]|uniref:hypothetical protein n=1 Tax=Paenibacillus campi TaxID=3106031 RepID=UPI002AFDCC4C|nr:hypothetical protein [Paenibacillus sp. SGZ-1014]